jgi:hypothetical protein
LVNEKSENLKKIKSKVMIRTIQELKELFENDFEPTTISTFVKI